MKPEWLQYVSLGLEVVIIALGLRMVLVKKRLLGAGIALSFTLYVAYNLIKMNRWNVPELAEASIFFVATLAIFLSILYLDWRGEK
ncbi:MAG TPA: hypothetical protein VHC95_07680 [Opitutales bacterium]|nr:hypothetical protein [Opitutales bacterium]